MDKNRIVILGGGESGVGAAMLAKKIGADVFVSDFGEIKPAFQKELQEAGIAFESKKHSDTKILNANIIIKSPGIPETAPIMKAIRAEEIKVISEIEFAAQHSKGKLVAITGTNGKTTTTALTAHLLEKAGLDVAMVGNVGDSFARQVALADKEYYVIEVSSFQLDDIERFKPYIAILLNITPDHLDRYDNSLEKYIAAKFKIFENQTAEDFAIISDDDELIQQHLKKNKLKARQIPFTIKKKTKEVPMLKMAA